MRGSVGVTEGRTGRIFAQLGKVDLWLEKERNEMDTTLRGKAVDSRQAGGGEQTVVC